MVTSACRAASYRIGHYSPRGERWSTGQSIVSTAFIRNKGWLRRHATAGTCRFRQRETYKVFELPEREDDRVRVSLLRVFVERPILARAAVTGRVGAPAFPAASLCTVEPRFFIHSSMRPSFLRHESGKDLGVAQAGASGSKRRFVHSSGRLLLHAALCRLVLLTFDLSLRSFLLIEQERFDGRDPRQRIQSL